MKEKLVLKIRKFLEVKKLEFRMRPGRWSEKGFLGSHEKLMDVIRDDTATLKRLGVTHDQIADKIEELLKAGIEWDSAGALKLLKVLEELEKGREGCRVRRLSLHDIPVIIGHFNVKVKRYRGHQRCPWAKDQDHRCTVGSGPKYGNTDFVITNNRTGEALRGPGLIVHLIRDHHFFEGRQSPYRVDPEKAARVLELTKE
ncbi:MAG: hypothetical protein ACETVR_03490 [Candidatus Bathyarchaeia archaeon]